MHLSQSHTDSHTTKRAAVIGIAVNGIWAAGLFDIAAMCRLWPSYNRLTPLGNLDPIFSLKLIKPIIPIISLMADRIKKHILMIAYLHFALFGHVDCLKERLKDTLCCLLWCVCEYLLYLYFEQINVMYGRSDKIQIPLTSKPKHKWWDKIKCWKEFNILELLFFCFVCLVHTHAHTPLSPVRGLVTWLTALTPPISCSSARSHTVAWLWLAAVILPVVPVCFDHCM